MGFPSQDTPGVEVLHSSAALRQWSASLRAWSRATRSRSMALRMTMPLIPSMAVAVLVPFRPDFMVAEGDRRDVNPAVDTLSLGLISVAELFEILVDSHGRGARESVNALVVELERAGYPSDATSVTASDGFDIVQAILDRRG